jgi:beta-lactamase superfamily II metal-dependent hydrolase
VPDPLRVRIFNVGEGDAIAGILPGGQRAFVVDVFKADPILDFLEAEGISEVVLFISHSDRDHIRGVKDFLAGFEPPRSILGILCNKDRLRVDVGRDYKKTLQFIGDVSRRESKRDPRHLRTEFNTNLNEMPRYGQLFEPGVRARVVHPAPQDQDSLIDTDTNEASGVLLLEHQLPDGTVQKIMLAADVQLTAISLMLDRAAAGSLEADVLKFPHHGAWPITRPGARAVGVDRRSMDDFLRAVSPRAVILSVGFDNPYGHVRSEVFDAMRRYHKDTDRLKSLKCTQFTPACLGADALPASGELSRSHCAGDVEIRMGEGVGANGLEIVTIPGSHSDRVALLHGVGSVQCAFLPEIQSRIASPQPGSPNPTSR